MKSTEISPSQLLTLENTDPIQMGFWVPNRIWASAKFMAPLRKHIEKKRAEGTLKDWVPVIAQFQTWLFNTTVFYPKTQSWQTYAYVLQEMIDQSNDFMAHQDQAIRDEILEDGDTIFIPNMNYLLTALNEIITTSPSFNNTVMVGTPMNGLLAVSMATEAGLFLFHNEPFNQQLKLILNTWNAFLKSPDSLDKLDINDPEKPGSWISQAAWAAGVWDQMVHDPNLPGYGFDSWNSFFIRKFVPGARPFQGTSEVVDIGCETTPWQYSDNLKYHTPYWIKDVDYSLIDIFGRQEEWASLFVGGQSYQGFLSATHYHRWNSPIDGEIVRSWVQPGTYFAQRPFQGEDPGTWEGTESQPYLANIAARAIFIFKHPQCGYIGLICIGMVEVSTCVIDSPFLVDEGATPVAITKGEEIGHFEFGGSTHMMIFQKDKVKLEEWAIHAVAHRNDKKPTKMGTVIARPV
ncbi:phophatidylserine decarboxylase associated domain-containing protein [bacterium SCSIO 12741]|nr:phophatidylserine decarboxylase associated domain-containing protein [bacterium SCSIO 12741]